jgi:[ribosomal protein S5]-alanine N-acetyltransferase
MTPRLETQRLLLTLPGPEHIDALIDYGRRNREHLAALGPPEPKDGFTVPFWERRVQAIADEFRAGQSVRFSVWKRDAPRGAVIGGVSLGGIILAAMRGCYMGYHIDQAEQGKGLMSEAVGAVIGYAFGELRLHRISANYVPTNERSGRLLKRLGFGVEGYARDYLFVGGQWRDHVLTALVNHDLVALPDS